MDTKTIRALAKLDPVLARLIREVGPVEISPDPGQSPYAALVRSIIYQQLHGKAAATIHGRLLKLYPKKRHPTPEDLLATSDTVLRGAGVSAAKARALKDLSLKASEGLVPTAREIVKLSDEEIIETLTQIRGIGRWTVEMLLIFKLGRPDVLPVTDFGVRNGYTIAFGLPEFPTPKALTAEGTRWAPYRTTAALYLWRAVDRAKARTAQSQIRISRA